MESPYETLKYGRNGAHSSGDLVGQGLYRKFIHEIEYINDRMALVRASSGKPKAVSRTYVIYSVEGSNDYWAILAEVRKTSTLWGEYRLDICRQRYTDDSPLKHLNFQTEAEAIKFLECIAKGYYND